jgi:hypothetical protein
MPHTTTATTRQSRTGRSPYPAPGPVRKTPRTTPSTMPFWHGMALLFAPAKNNEQP